MIKSTEIRALTDKEAEESRQKHGSNALTPPPSVSFWAKLWETFRGDALIRILTVALIITVLFAIFGVGDWLEAVGIAIAVILATTVATYSEYSNDQLFQKLQDEYSKILCKVFRRRDNAVQVANLNIDEIATGDFVLLQAGDKVCADGILVSGEIKVNQASLNGESEDATKLAVGDGYVYDASKVDFLDPNKVFRGTVVTDGEGIMEVRAVGDRSEFGKLAQELSEDEERESPLKLKLSRVADGISKFGYIGGSLIAIAFMLNAAIWNPTLLEGATTYFSSPNLVQILSDVVSSITLAVVIIVVAVPEGLPMMIALVSGLNMKKLLRDNILIRKIDGAETAGSLNILFSDKTGTITKGALEVVNFTSTDGQEYKAMSSIPKELREMLLISICGNTNAVALVNNGKLQVTGGNATERALHEFVGAEGSLLYEGYKLECTDSLMFNSKNKYSASVLTGRLDRAIIKGAPEKLLSHCTHYYDETLTQKPLTDEIRDAMELRMTALAEKAMRVLAFATSAEGIGDNLLQNMCFVGIVGIRDELRPEAVEAIKTAKAAGIQVVMVTGDKKETAIAIARDAKLMDSDDDLALTSEDLAALSDEELKAILPRLHVVARALPTDKSRLVRVSQEQNLVVGMTGDGVNDAPALKRADVGFAMGSGTEVSKEAAEITILDDNFNSLVKTVLYGRTIYNNIRKFIVFQLTINVSAVLLTLVGPFLGIDHPLSITQMLWVNIVMDTLAALALGGEPALARYMEEKPKRRDEAIISKNMWTAIITVGLYLTTACLLFLTQPFFLGLFNNGGTLVYEGRDIYFMTAFFCFYVFSAMLNGFNARTEKLNFLDNIGGNKMFFGIMALIFGVQILMVYVGGAILRTAPLDLTQLALVFLLSLAILPIGLVRKLIFPSKTQ